jgi:hypothetical protein
VIEWKDPPPEDRPSNWATRHARKAIAAELRQNPGDWAIVTRSTRSNGYTVAQKIREGVAEHWRPAGAFEARYVVDTDDPLRGAVYVRFVGHETEDL